MRDYSWKVLLQRLTKGCLIALAIGFALLLSTTEVAKPSPEPIARPTSRPDIVKFHRLTNTAALPLATPTWSSENIGSNAVLLAPIPGHGLLVAYTTMERLRTSVDTGRLNVQEIRPSAPL